MQLTPNYTAEQLGVAGCEQRLIDNARVLCERILEPIRAHTRSLRPAGSKKPSRGREGQGGSDRLGLRSGAETWCQEFVPDGRLSAAAWPAAQWG